jgi:hypothetical protein
MATPVARGPSLGRARFARTGVGGIYDGSDSALVTLKPNCAGWRTSGKAR